MALFLTDKIDILGLDSKTNEIFLVIADEVDWSNVNEHLFTLQRKLNKYIAFIESGEINVAYPKAKGLPKRIDLVFKFPPPEISVKFCDTAKDIIVAAGIRLNWSVRSDLN